MSIQRLPFPQKRHYFLQLFLHIFFIFKLTFTVVRVLTSIFCNQESRANDQQNYILHHIVRISNGKMGVQKSPYQSISTLVTERMVKQLHSQAVQGGNAVAGGGGGNKHTNQPRFLRYWWPNPFLALAGTSASATNLTRKPLCVNISSTSARFISQTDSLSQSSFPHNHTTVCASTNCGQEAIWSKNTTRLHRRGRVSSYTSDRSESLQFCKLEDRLSFLQPE